MMHLNKGGNTVIPKPAFFLSHTLRNFNQGILRHKRELSVDFDEDCFFAAVKTVLNCFYLATLQPQEAIRDGARCDRMVVV
jgi:hypothetical protein